MLPLYKSAKKFIMIVDTLKKVCYTVSVKILALMERVLQSSSHTESRGWCKAVAATTRKTLRSLRKKAFLVTRTARLSRKDLIKRAVSNDGQFGWYRGRFEPFVPFGTKAFCFVPIA